MRRFLSVFVLPLVGLTMHAGVAGLDALASESQHPTLTVAAVAVVTTTTAPPSPTTTAPPPKRASRSDARRTPPVRLAPVAPVDPGGDCMTGWAFRDPAAQTAKAHRCWDDLLARYSWNQTTAFRIMMCESGGDPHNIGPPTRYGRAQGLMQILPGGSFDPETNMAQAWSKYQRSGWRPWVCK